MPRALRRLVHLVLFCPLSKGLQVRCPPLRRMLHGKTAPVFELAVAQQGRRQVRPVRASGYRLHRIVQAALAPVFWGERAEREKNPQEVR